MKKIYFMLVCILYYHVQLFSQAPNMGEGFSFQAVLRTKTGQVIPSKKINIKISIMADSAGKQIYYVEDHNMQTSNIGSISFNIGKGKPISGTFKNIDWSKNAKFLKVEFKETESSAYELFSITQLTAVPYSLHANTVSIENDPKYSNSIASSISSQDTLRWNSMSDSLALLKNIITSGLALPKGAIIMWSGTTIPTGWAICNGDNNTPDLRGRFVLGGTVADINKKGGNDSITISSTQLPSHNHTASISTADGNHTHSGTTGNESQPHAHTYRFDAVAGGYAEGSGKSAVQYVGDPNKYPSSNNTVSHTHNFSISSSGAHTHAITIDDTGQGQLINIMPKYYVLVFIMKL